MKEIKKLEIRGTNIEEFEVECDDCHGAAEHFACDKHFNEILQDEYERAFQEGRESVENQSPKEE